MSQPVIITCAVTGGAPIVEKNRVPVTPQEIADSALEAWRAGAAIVHIHVRDPNTGQQSNEFRYYEDVVNRIRRSGSDVLINLTTGFGGRYIPNLEDRDRIGPGSNVISPADRCRHVVELRPELCSLDMGSMNFGNIVFVNTPAIVAEIAKAVTAAGVLPELEIFEPGHLRLARELLANGTLPAPGYFQLCLGVRWGSAADTRTMQFLVDQLPAEARWSAFGVAHSHFAMAAQSLILGGHVRVGLEDNLYIERGVAAPGNYSLVERAVVLANALGRPVASAREARTLLGILS
ncbi:BKACE family enzyme [Peristeroidobacter soli]|jgi:uncharacterized protein (DUF849 family)|uniref:3-keto-5-aminohexanoate cleavage protein n=1 Tax=Peristeroidobacter soli TaxID=2497877 RepID=UPI00101D9C17|nr:3-keto-5-aminohexanoate cleavage protein [Peristeroidobacter soli]